MTITNDYSIYLNKINPERSEALIKYICKVDLIATIIICSSSIIIISLIIGSIFYGINKFKK